MPEEDPFVSRVTENRSLRNAGNLVFGRYRLEKRLGNGAMGEVWKASDENQRNRAVALKFLLGSSALNQRQRESLQAEALTVMDLHHTNIVTVYDFAYDENDPLKESAIVMEYIEGQTLSERQDALPNGVFEVKELLPIVEQLVLALEYAHSEIPPVLHRDMKPDNVMVTANGVVKLMDFGLAETARNTLSLVSKEVADAVKSAGTPAYMSPQHQDGEIAKKTDDLYSLGATIYELLTGLPPFHRGNIDRQIEKIKAPKMAARRRELDVKGEAIPVTWESGVAALLSKKAKDRPVCGAGFLGIVKGNRKAAPWLLSMVGMLVTAVLGFGMWKGEWFGEGEELLLA